MSTSADRLEHNANSYLDIERETGGYPAVHEHHASVD
jgi:hypothetical protein